jgi:hypothetical protein
MNRHDVIEGIAVVHSRGSKNGGCWRDLKPKQHMPTGIAKVIKKLTQKELEASTPS